MKKFSFLLALSLLASAFAFSPTKAQDDKQSEFERNWYDVCYTKKDKEKCYQLSKELLATYPKSTYAKNAGTIVKNSDDLTAYKTANDRFQAALKAYYSAPDGNKLDQLFGAGEDLLKIVPGNQYVVGQMALAGAQGGVAQIYKNLDKVKGYGEQSLKLFESATPPEGWEKASWESLRELTMAQINQFIGFYLIETKGDKAQAVAYLTKSTMVKNKDGAGWKDPFNYWLRASVGLEEYQALRAEYDKLTDEQKIGEPGKELLKKVNEVVDAKLIPDYARAMAAATKPEQKSLLDAAKANFDAYWNFRTKAPEKAADYVKAFSADPTVAGPPIPVKVEDSGDPSTLQAPAGTNQKPMVSVGGAPGGVPGGGKTSANGNGKTTTTSKAKAAPKAAPKSKSRRKKP